MSEWIATNLIPPMSIGEWLGLALVTAIVAGALSLEHYAVGRKAWPKRRYYAIGLLTVAGPLLLWAGVERIGFNLGTGLLLLGAGCLAGLPDWILLRRREARLLTAWRAMVERNRRMASDLARARLVADYRTAELLDDMIIGVGFNLGCMKSDLEALEVLSSQLRPALERFLVLFEDAEDD